MRPEFRRVIWPAATVVATLLVLSGYVFGYVPDIEDYYSTALTTSLFVRTVFEGVNPLWTPLLGLGMPQPFRISLIQHPLAFLFGFLSPLASIRSIVVVQGVVASSAFYLLARTLRVPRVIAAVAAMTFIFSASTIEFLYFDDFFSAFLSYCLLPVILLLFVRLTDEVDRRRAVGFALGLGVTIGLLIATGLVSHVLSMLLVLGLAFVAGARAALRQWRPLLLAFFVAALAVSGLGCLLLREWLLFPPTALRAAHDNASLYAHLASALEFDFWRALAAGSQDAFRTATLVDNHRKVGFGAVAALVAVATLFLRLGPRAAPIKAGFVASILLLALPRRAYGDLISATWVFRDCTNFFGALLFGLGLAWLWRRGAAARRLVGVLLCAQVLLLGSTAVPPWQRAIDAARNPGAHPIGLGHAVAAGRLYARVKMLAGPDAGRLVMSPDVTRAERVKDLLAIGGAFNLGAPEDLATLNAAARGIATSALHPDDALMEGFVDATNANLEDERFLDVLGIGTVLTFEGEKVARGLEPVGSIEIAPRRILVWRNPNPWPPVSELDPSAREYALHPIPGCGHDRFLCLDYTPVRDLLRGHPATDVVVRGGGIRFRLPPSEQERLLMLNVWYRPEWRSNDPRVEVFPVFGQLIGVLAPAGVTEVALTYRPWDLLIGYVVSTSTLVVGGLAAIWLVTRSDARSARHSTRMCETSDRSAKGHRG